MVRLKKEVRDFLDRVALTMRETGKKPEAAMRHVLARDSAITRAFRENAQARRAISQRVLSRVRRKLGGRT